MEVECLMVGKHLMLLGCIRGVEGEVEVESSQVGRGEVLENHLVSGMQGWGRRVNSGGGLGYGFDRLILGNIIKGVGW